MDVDANAKATTASTKLLSELVPGGLTAGTYNWRLTYAGDTNGNADFTVDCGVESFTIKNS